MVMMLMLMLLLMMMTVMVLQASCQCERANHAVAELDGVALRIRVAVLPHDGLAKEFCQREFVDLESRMAQGGVYRTPKA